MPDKPEFPEDIQRNTAISPYIHYPDKTRYVLPYVPEMISLPHPQQYPMLKFPEDIYFLIADDYIVDKNNRIYFHDRASKEDVYLSEIDTTNHNQLSKTEMIYTDLSKKANHLKTKDGIRDTVVYANRIYLDFITKDNTVAFSTAKRDIVFSLNRHGNGLMDNIYEITSTFRHEFIHIRDNHPIKYEREQIPNLEHAEVYLEQMSYEEFRNSTKEYQANRIARFASYIISGHHTNAFDINKINNHFEKFNTGFGKEINASVNFDLINKKIIVYVQEKLFEYDYLKFKDK